MKDWEKSGKETRREREGEHGTMSQALCRVLRDLVCEEQEEPDCRKCPLRNVDCYNMHDNRAMQGVLMELFGSHPAKVGDTEKEKCRSDAPESPVTAFKFKTGISYSTDKNKPLRNDSSVKTAKPYPQDTEEDEYRYIDAGWLEAVARGLTAGAEKHPGETWRKIPPEEHAARAMRHLNLYRAGDRKDTHLINAAMRCMMAYVTEKARGEGQA
ncbi:dATP/dGTP diphosphohydrolase domain-containing protein [Selenomonas bovis]|uniref:dATP/dGTP diphosphohydrolase domain-containing protein n=1 Tax=Selenomonas bovis TaxID=416586 RepID=UPI003AB92BC8